MKKNEKIFITAIAIIAVIIIVGVLTLRSSKKQEGSKVGETENQVKEEFVEKLDDETKLNISEQLKTSKKIEGIEISDIQLTEKDNVSLILGTATNVSDQVQKGFTMDVKILDKEGKEIVTTGALIKSLQPGESTEFYSNATFDFANAYDFTVVKTGDYVE